MAKLRSGLSFIFSLCFLLSPSFLLAQDWNSIFNPTPNDAMREFMTDRPDKTESAYTVDAGHFQHETDLLNYVQDSAEGSTSSTLLVAAPNLKIGLTNSTDLQVVAQSSVYDKSSNPNEKRSGYGDTIIRLKQNIWGNDGGDTALAMMPYIKLPTNYKDLGNDKVEGGLIVPIALNYFEDYGIGAMTQIDYLREDDDTNNYFQFVNSLTVGTDLTESLGGYSEIWTAASNQAGFQVTLDFGLTYSICENSIIDVGVNIGTTNTADDINPFLGLSQRF